MNATALRGALAPGCGEKRAEPVDERGAEARQAITVERRHLRAKIAKDDLRRRTPPIVNLI